MGAIDIFLVRHGEAAASWAQSTDPGLSELGVRQARAAAQALHAELGADVQLLSSPLARAQETAAPLVELLAAPLQLHEAFREIPSPVPLAQRQDWLRQFMRERWEQQPEHLHQWREQALGQLRDLRAPAVIFTHFLVINAVVGHVQGSADTLCCWPDNGSITRLRLAAGGLELVQLGQQMETLVT